MDKNQALKLALEALEEPKEHIAKHRRLEAITAIKEALAQPEQEPDGYVQKVIDALYENSDPVSVEAAELLEHMAQPEQEPVIGTKTWIEDGKVVTHHLTAKDIYKEPEQIPPSAYSNTHQPEQEPVAWAQFSEAGNLIDLLEEPCGGYVPLYTIPPQRKPLTDEQRREIAFRWRDGNGTASEIINMVEAAHGIKE